MSTSVMRARCARTSGRRSRAPGTRSCTSTHVALEFAQRIRNIPVYPAADGYSLDADVAMLASNESPEPPLRDVVRAVERALAGVNRYPDPTNGALRAALAKRYDVPANRIAVG